MMAPTRGISRAGIAMFRTLLALSLVAMCASTPVSAAKNKPPKLLTKFQPISIQEGRRLDVILPAFTDPEGGAVVHTVLRRPSWLLFEPETRRLSGVPPFTEATDRKAKRVYKLVVNAVDDAGKRGKSKLVLTVLNAQPEPPVVQQSIALQVAQEDVPFSFSLPAGVFSHPSGVMSISWSGLPEHAIRSAEGFSLTPVQAEVGEHLVTVTATVEPGGSASTSFTLQVRNTNDPPMATPGDLSFAVVEDQPFDITFSSPLFTDEDGDELRFELAGDTEWLSFDAARMRLRGIAPETLNGTRSFVLVARDPVNASGARQVSLQVAPVEDPPELIDAPRDVYIPQGEFTHDTWGHARFRDPESKPLIMRCHGFPAWWPAASDDSTGCNRQSMRVGPEHAGVYPILVTATDVAGLEASVGYTVTVATSNRAPVQDVYFQLPAADAGSPYSYALPTGAFRDPDGDPLSYRLANAPSWLTVDPATGTLGGTPPTDAIEYSAPHLEVSDPAGANVAVMLHLRVTGSSREPGPRATVSGRIRAQGSVVADVDTNDLASGFERNDQPAERQAVAFTPALVTGFATSGPTLIPGARFEWGADTYDTYQVALRAGEAATLQISDHIGSLSSLSDLDLYLEDPVTMEVKAFSIGLGPVEQVIAPHDGTYNVVVHAYNGWSNYLLSVGGAHEMTVAALSDRSEFIIGEAIVGRRTSGGSGPQKSTRPLLLERLPTGARGAMKSDHGTARLTGSGSIGDKLDTARAIKMLKSDPTVSVAEPNLVRRAEAIPADPLFSEQWHYTDIGLPSAWDRVTGSSTVTVAVIDTGVVPLHPDLLGNLVPGYDFISNPARALDGDGIDPDPSDPGDQALVTESSFHGTHVAGTIGAVGGNGIGGTGVLQTARVMPLRVLGKGGGTSYDMIQAVRFAAGLSNDSGTVPERRADVMNLSLGGAAFSDAEQQAFAEARAQGVIVIASAGNSASETPIYPAAYAGVVSVAATDRNRRPARYSNFGPTVDVAAPGGDISVDLDGDGRADGVLSTHAVEGEGGIHPIYARLQGTSMAAPHVAGVAALMRVEFPGLTAEQFDDDLRNGRLTAHAAGSGAPNHDSRLGFGIIAADRAVLRARALASGTGEPAPPDGPSVNQLLASPGSLLLDHATDEAIITISRYGPLPSRVTTVSSDSPIITVTPFGVDADGIGRYAVRVNREGLPAGRHGFQLVFESDFAAALSVGVTVVQPPPAVTTGNNGVHHVLLLDPVSLEAVREARTSVIDGIYEYSLAAVPPGEYFLVFGTDHDSDSYICDDGESCGGYPTLSPLELVSVGTEDVEVPELTTAVQQVVGGQNLLPSIILKAPAGFGRKGDGAH